MVLVTGISAYRLYLSWWIVGSHWGDRSFHCHQFTKIFDFYTFQHSFDNIKIIGYLRLGAKYKESVISPQPKFNYLDK
ncbi:hypothetical protein B6N60_04128 [Richelia sinica FACHB-800]|uniref:Uncharacterized protein n=1 Tax=Richelia sinica FACHB-800 TaxID=1357546 RepID=A0A975TAV5_9NOST|nr:hypothetical protein B6N60_04128 [Richelia sinica FACHB-800]